MTWNSVLGAGRTPMLTGDINTNTFSGYLPNIAFYGIVTNSGVWTLASGNISNLVNETYTGATPILTFEFTGESGDHEIKIDLKRVCSIGLTNLSGTLHVIAGSFITPSNLYVYCEISRDGRFWELLSTNTLNTGGAGGADVQFTNKVSFSTFRYVRWRLSQTGALGASANVRVTFNEIFKFYADYIQNLQA